MSSLKIWARGVLRDKFEDRAIKRALASVRDAARDGILDKDPDALVSSAMLVHERHSQNIEDLLKKLREMFPDAEVKVRLKTIASILGKLPRRPDKYDEPELLEDVSGAAIVVPTLDDVDAVVEALRNSFEVTDDEDCIEDPKNHGYRAHHITIVDDDGLPKEIQVRTYRQDAFAQWEHSAYKPTNDQQRDVLQRHGYELSKFASAASDYMHALDVGEDAERPEAPIYIEKAFGLPWPTSEDGEARDRIASSSDQLSGDDEFVEASQVGERLWVGSKPTSPSAIEKHFDSLVLAANQYQPSVSEFENVEVYEVPMHDGIFTIDEAIKARDAARWVNQQRALGRRVLVTCMSGLNRSAVIAAMALRTGPEHLSTQQAVDRVRAARGRHALHHPGAIDAISFAR